MGDDSPDPITVVRVHLAGAPPGVVAISVCRRSLAVRLRRVVGSFGDTVDDLGPAALLLTQAAKAEEFGPDTLLLLGVAQGNRWLAWYPPAPREPVPGTPGDTAQRN